MGDMLSSNFLLGVFLAVSGFSLCVYNFSKTAKPSVGRTGRTVPMLISENIMLMFIGAGYTAQSWMNARSMNVNFNSTEGRFSFDFADSATSDCNFLTVLTNYGPMILAAANGFVSLVFRNYDYLKITKGRISENNDNIVQDLSSSPPMEIPIKSYCLKLKNIFPYLSVLSHWLIPTALLMGLYPVSVKEMKMLRQDTDTCVMMLAVGNDTCVENELDVKNIPTFLDAIEYHKEIDRNNETDIVVKKIYDIISNFKMSDHNNSPADFTVGVRTSKSFDCIKMCYLDASYLTLYFFVLILVCYFVPIVISIIIITKLHTLKSNGVKVPNHLNSMLEVVFWTPAMFDAFLSMMFCSYRTEAMRTSVFTIVANIYQVVRSFINSRHFDNAVSPASGA